MSVVAKGLTNLLREICQSAGGRKLLTKEREKELGEIVQASNVTEVQKRNAINELVLKNIFLVLKISHNPKYKRKEFEFEDIVGYGIIGLFKAAKRFDPRRFENRFATYAKHWIKESMMGAIRECSGTPKIPVYRVKNLWCVSRALARQGGQCSDETLANLTGLSVGDVSYLRSLLFEFVSYDPVYTGIDTYTPEDRFVAIEREGLIKEALKSSLTSDEFTVLAHFRGLYGYTKMSSDEIEKELEIENPKKLKASAMEKLGKCEILKLLYDEGE